MAKNVKDDKFSGFKKVFTQNSKVHSKSEIAFFNVLSGLSFLVLLLLVVMFITLLISSFPAIKKLGVSFLTRKNWNPVLDEYGALPFLVGTLLTSILALLISTPFSIAISVFLGEYFKEGIIATTLKSVIELLASIPSVIYGLWALFVLVPVIQKMEMQIGVTPYGVGIFTASVVLAIMVTPYSASLAREVITMVPRDLKEAAYSLGATRSEVITKVVIPNSFSGIIAGVLLSFGRALGETMAVTMVIGNANKLPKSIFDPANTMASIIANEFTEAVGEVYLSSLIEMGLLLFVVTMIINIVGREVIKKFSIQ